LPPMPTYTGISGFSFTPSMAFATMRPADLSDHSSMVLSISTYTEGTLSDEGPWCVASYETL